MRKLVTILLLCFAIPAGFATAGKVTGVEAIGITVSDMELARDFYTRILPFEVVSETEVAGSEIERLNNVFGARLKITSVGASRGPAIEFLEYLSPSTGRAIPRDSRANDLWQGQIQLAVDDLAALSAALRENGGRWVSPGAVDLRETGLGFHSGLLARGPNGHGLLLIKKE